MPFFFAIWQNINRQLKVVAPTFTSLGKWVDSQLADVRAIESQTRAYPIIRFHNGALSVRLASFQAGALVRHRPTGLGPTLHSAGRRFVSGLGTTASIIGSDLLLPRSAVLLIRLANFVDESLDRLLPIGPSLFDPSKRRGSDLIALGLLGAAIGSRSMEQFKELKKSLGEFAGTKALSFGEILSPAQSAFGELLAVFFGPSEAGASSTEDAVKEGRSSFSLSGVVDGLVASLLLIPLLPAVVTPILQGMVLKIKTAFLLKAKAVEEEVFGLRSYILDGLVDGLRSLMIQAADFLAVGGFIFVKHVDFFSRFAEHYTKELFMELTFFIHKMARFLIATSKLAEVIRSLIEAVWEFDLTDLIVSSLGFSGIPTVLLNQIPKVTLGDLIGAYVRGGMGAVHKLLGIWLSGLEAVLQSPGARLAEWAFDTNYLERLQAGQKALDLLFSPTAATPKPAKAPNFTAISAPTLNFGSPAKLKSFALDLAALGQSARQLTKDTLLGGADLLEGLAKESEALADAATQNTLPRRYRRLANWAVGLGKTLFSDQMQTLARRSMERSRDNKLTRTYERFLIENGFAMLGRVIPAYLSGMRQRWRERAEARAKGSFGPTDDIPPYKLPTSPHLVDKRVRLGRVKMPRLTICARRPHDDSLAEEIGVHFKQQIEAAYVLALGQV